MDEGMGAMRAALLGISQDLEQAATVVAKIWANNQGGENAAKYHNMIVAAQQSVNEADHMLLGAQAKAVAALIVLARAEGEEPR